MSLLPAASHLIPRWSLQTQILHHQTLSLLVLFPHLHPACLNLPLHLLLNLLLLTYHLPHLPLLLPLFLIHLLLALPLLLPLLVFSLLLLHLLSLLPQHCQSLSMMSPISGKISCFFIVLSVMCTQEYEELFSKT